MMGEVLKQKNDLQLKARNDKYTAIVIKIAKYLLILYMTYIVIAPGYFGTVIVLQLAMKSDILWIKIYSMFFMVIMLIWAIVSQRKNRNFFYIQYISIIGIANIIIAYNYVHFPITELIKKVLYPFA